MSDRTPTPTTAWTGKLPSVHQVRSWAAEGNIPVPCIVGALVMLFPVGLFFVWQKPQWATKTKAIWTGGWAVAFLLAMWLVMPFVIVLTLLGTLTVALLAIWSSSTLPLDKKKLATGGAVGGFAVCLLATFAFYSIRAYNAEQEESRRRGAEQLMKDKQQREQRDELVRQKLSEADRLWSEDKAKSVALSRECIELGIPREASSTPYQRVIEFDVQAGNLSSAKSLIRKARYGGWIELAFTDPKCNELLKEVESQLAEEKRVEDERRTIEAKSKQEQAQRTEGNTASSGKVTRANYNAVNDGMTEGEVVALLGQPQKTLLTNIDGLRINDVLLSCKQWSDYSGTIIQIEFRSRKVVRKAITSLNQ